MSSGRCSWLRGCWSRSWMIRLACSAVASTCQKIRPRVMSKNTHPPCRCPRACPQWSPPNQDDLSLVLPSKSYTVPLRGRIQLNPVVKRIQEIQWVVRRVRIFLKRYKLYLVWTISWTISSLYILFSYLNFQTHQWQHHILPNMVPGDVPIMNPKIGDQNFL